MLIPPPQNIPECLLRRPFGGDPQWGVLGSARLLVEKRVGQQGVEKIGFGCNKKKIDVFLVVA